MLYLNFFFIIIIIIIIFFIIVSVIYFRIYIYLFTCVFVHCVCRVSVECKVHYGNKKITPV